MDRGDVRFGLACGGLAAIVLLLFSDGPSGDASLAVAACALIGTGASRLSRSKVTVETLPWPLRALVMTFWWALAAAALARLVDLLVAQDTARAIFFVLLGLGAVLIFLGEFANRRDAPQGSGRPSQSS